MDDSIARSGVWLGWILVGFPVFVSLLWWWNEIFYIIIPRNSGRSTGSDAKLPPGNMGLPFFGEMLSFLWYFKVVGRPDDFINSKRRKYGDGVGLYRSHLFGSPSIIACFPAVNKYILQNDDIFHLDWPNVGLVGHRSIVAVHGDIHSRLRSFVSDAINKPDALRAIALQVQPRMIAALKVWATKGNITVHHQVKKVTFVNIGKIFVSFEPGPLLDSMDTLFEGVIKGFRAYPSNIPGTANHHAHQCRKKLEAIFRKELEKKKLYKCEEKTNDLMDGLMNIKNEQGNKLTDQEVIDNIVSLVLAGYESTTLATMWAIYYLAKFPKVMQQLREENIAMSKTKAGDFITREDVSKLKYTNKVVEETIRMANIAAILFRLVRKESEYKGYRIPKNWKVVVWARYLHTNPENFEDPMCFNPDRWDEPAKPGTYQVFGGGSRICAGNMLARIQVALFLHHLSVGYEWELVNPNASMVYLPHPKPVDGVQVVLRKCTSFRPR